MARKKTTKLEKEELTGDLERVVEALCLHQQTNLEGLRPCLVGGTGAGKTTLAKEIAARLSLRFLRLLPSQQLPEDIGGWPNGEGDSMVFKLMEELKRACDEPYFILLDEIDKARPDTMGTLLTMLYEKAIRNHTLHPQTVICCAMQPVNPSLWLADETGKALSARFTFLHVPNRWRYIEDKFGVSLPHLHERESSRTLQPPVMEATPRTVECVLHFLRSAEGMKLNKPERNMVLYGTIAKQDAEVIEATLNQHVAWVNPVEAAEIDPEKTIEHLDVHTIAKNIGPLLKKLNAKSWTNALEKVWLNGSEEDAKEFLENGFNYLKGQCEASSDNSVEIFGNATPEEIVKATNEAGEMIAKIWTERAKGKTK